MVFSKVMPLNASSPNSTMLSGRTMALIAIFFNSKPASLVTPTKYLHSVKLKTTFGYEVALIVPRELTTSECLDCIP